MSGLFRTVLQLVPLSACPVTPTLASPWSSPGIRPADPATLSVDQQSCLTNYTLLKVLKVRMHCPPHHPSFPISPLFSGPKYLNLAALA